MSQTIAQLDLICRQGRRGSKPRGATYYCGVINTLERFSLGLIPGWTHSMSARRHWTQGDFLSQRICNNLSTQDRGYPAPQWNRTTCVTTRQRGNAPCGTCMLRTIVMLVRVRQVLAVINRPRRVTHCTAAETGRTWDLARNCARGFGCLISAYRRILYVIHGSGFLLHNCPGK